MLPSMASIADPYSVTEQVRTNLTVEILKKRLEHDGVDASDIESEDGKSEDDHAAFEQVIANSQK